MNCASCGKPFNSQSREDALNAMRCRLLTSEGQFKNQEVVETLCHAVAHFFDGDFRCFCGENNTAAHENLSASDKNKLSLVLFALQAHVARQ